MSRRWWWVAGAAGLVLGWFGGPAVARHLSLFRVRRVEVVGSTYLTPAEVARIAQIPPGANIFDDREPWRRKVLQVRGVARVEVRRRIPGAVIFDITEFAPVAQTQVNGKLALLDRRGRVLPFDPTRGAADLPIAEADSAVTGLIDRVEDADPELFAAIQWAGRRQGTVVLETGKHRILFRVGATTKDILGAGAVLAELAKSRMAVAEVDARFRGRVIVRGRP